MAAKEYRVLTQEDSSNAVDLEAWNRRAASSRSTTYWIWILSLLLVLSGSANIVSFTALKKPDHQSQGYVPGLTRDIPTPIPHDNRTIDDEMWNDPRFNSFNGLVALNEEYVQDHDLLSAQRWPWDSSKSIYMLHGFHSLHCVMMLRDTMIQVRDGESLSWPFSHITHCLHVLREDVLCYADDFPRYTGRLHAEAEQIVTSSGTGAIRMCRNWDRLRQFALDNSACYSRPLDAKSEVLDRYKSCPDGSRPWEKSTHS